MAFKTVVDTLEELDEPLREHYVEVKDKDGKVTYVIGLDGDVKPLPSFKSIISEAAANRIKAKDFEGKYGKLKAFEGMDHAEIIAKIDRITELEALAEGKLDDKKVNEIVEGRVRAKLTPLERQIAALTTERDTFKTQFEDMSKKDKQRMIGDEVRSAAVKLKMLPEAIEDAIILAERNLEVTEEGVVTKGNADTPENWLKDLQAKRPHWWGPSAGGGGKGGGGGGAGGVNPFTAEHWNVTQQNQLYTADPKRAEALASRAGTKVGGLKPPKAAK